MQTKLGKTLKLILTLLWMALFAVGCIAQPSAGRKVSLSSSSTESPTPTPTFSSSQNYFQSGTKLVNSTLSLPVDFTDSFYVRGSQIHYFITTGNVNTAQCLVSYFPQSTGKKFLVSMANPRYLFNQSTGIKEYYYLIEPSNSTQNRNFCQKTGLINALSRLDATGGLAFSLSEVCPSCSTSMNLTSSPIAFYTSGGNTISDIQTNYLRTQIVAGTSTSSPNSCTSSSQCQGLGYQCCSVGQCVNDGQTKSGIDTTSNEYKQALQDILSNPSAVQKYPNFFYICSTSSDATPTPTPTPNVENEAATRLEYLKELYSCTTPIKGEMSLCTVTYNNATSVTQRFVTGYDDRTFRDTQPSNSSLPTHSLYKVTHATETLYENKVFTTSPQGFYIGDLNGNYAGNDTLSDLLEIRLNHAKKTSAPNDDLKITYKIDGSCKKISTGLAQCIKYYTQGQNYGEVDDHYPGTDTFLIPKYADLSRMLKVEVDDVVKIVDSDWTLTPGSPASITFIGNGEQIFDTQVVKITFYVSLTDHPYLMTAKDKALSEIDRICNCGGPKCTLTPEYSGSQIINYTCVYPQPDVPPLPSQQTVMLSSKNVPVRFFDNTGVYHSKVTLSTPPQEGTKFEYTKNDKLKPNNLTQSIGFNEIYGSLTTAADSAKPALEVTVKQGKNYEIFVDGGLFSTCTTCGSDYYNSINRLFPSAIGPGGLIPSSYKNVTDKFKSTAESYRADDFIFGRACFVPATMIPWTHRALSPRADQRQARMAAQHFMFANGYQRDWYGFDYGSVIGSFDGVTWFSVGTQRRILAKTNKLFLAVNGFYGDLTNDNTYRVTVTDSSAISVGSGATSDYESDGAQCQKFHGCQTDRDCITQLGWDYSCQAVTNIQSSWPVFDINAQENPGRSQTVRLAQLISGSTGSAKRCVYRGRGTPCHQNYDDATDETRTYDGTNQLGLHACSSNNYCQNINEGLPAQKFNDRISRFGKSPSNINSTYNVNYSTFGLAAKILGRPFDYNGTATVTEKSNANFVQNKVNSLCIPGRNIGTEVTRLVSASKATPDIQHMGDQVNNQGMTLTGNTAQSEYFSSCPVVDSLGNLLAIKDSFISTRPLLGNTELVRYAGSQVISTNSLTLLQSSLDSSQAIMKNFVTESALVTRPYLQENRCLRAPGTLCHTDLDCAPSKFISDRTGLISSTSVNDGTNSNGLNRYELQFWQEGLVCGQSEDKTTKDTDGREIVNPNYDLKNNRCCREMGKNITIGTFVPQTSYTAEKPYFSSNTVPGLDIDLNNKARYSRWSTVNYEMKDPSTSANYPALETARDGQCALAGGCDPITDVYKQFNTFGQIADRTSCSGHWVRNFHSSIGGGHKWEATKSQNIPVTSFRCYNWLPCSVADGTCSATSPISGATGFSCSHTSSHNDAKCLIKSLTKDKAKKIFDWMNSLEILGVPQATVLSADFDEIRCEVDPLNQSTAGTLPAPNIIKTTQPGEYTGNNDDATDSGKFYSGNNKSNFYADAGQLKMIFSPDTVSCCKPAGTQVGTSADANLCCTGYISDEGRCAFKDYINVSVYYNRYISSAAKSLALANFNPRTGFIKDKATVMRLACEQKVCASGYIGTGIAYNNLSVPGHESNPNALVYRFLDSDRDNTNGLVDFYKAGLRWNEDVYCIKKEVYEEPPAGMTVKACDQ